MPRAAVRSRWPVELPLGRTGRGVLAQDLGRDALADLALGIAVFEQRHVGMRVHVDESGATIEPARVDDPPRGTSAPETAHRGDPVAADRHVALEPGIAGAVDDLAAADHDVIRLGEFVGLRNRPDASRATRTHPTRLHNIFFDPHRKVVVTAWDQGWAVNSRGKAIASYPWESGSGLVARSTPEKGASVEEPRAEDEEIPDEAFLDSLELMSRPSAWLPLARREKGGYVIDLIGRRIEDCRHTGLSCCWYCNWPSRIANRSPIGS